MKNTENGRSMIEMLGVLAIIGVLSVGGIAGYSKAMMKYRINKTIEQISLIVGNFRTFYGRFSDARSGFSCAFCGDEHTDKVIQKAKILPEEMMVLTDGKLTGAVNAFGGSMGIEYEPSSKEFWLAFTGIPVEACIELLTHDWRTANIHKVDYSGEGGWKAFDFQADINEATEICSHINEDENYFVEFYFKIR